MVNIVSQKGGEKYENKLKLTEYHCNGFIFIIDRLLANFSELKPINYKFDLDEMKLLVENNIRELIKFRKINNVKFDFGYAEILKYKNFSEFYKHFYGLRDLLIRELELIKNKEKDITINGNIDIIKGKSKNIVDNYSDEFIVDLKFNKFLELINSLLDGLSLIIPRSDGFHKDDIFNVVDKYISKIEGFIDEFELGYIYDYDDILKLETFGDFYEYFENLQNSTVELIIDRGEKNDVNYFDHNGVKSIVKKISRFKEYKDSISTFTLFEEKIYKLFKEIPVKHSDNDMIINTRNIIKNGFNNKNSRKFLLNESDGFTINKVKEKSDFLENIFFYVIKGVLKAKLGKDFLIYKASFLDDYLGSDYILINKVEEGYKIVGIDLTTSSSEEGLNNKGIDINRDFSNGNSIKTRGKKKLPDFIKTIFPDKNISKNCILGNDINQDFLFDNKILALESEFSKYVIFGFINYLSFNTDFDYKNEIDYKIFLIDIIKTYKIPDDYNSSNLYRNNEDDGNEFLQNIINNLDSTIEGIFDNVENVNHIYNESLDSLYEKEK